MLKSLLSVPYPKPPQGLLRQIHPFLKNGGLAGSTADQLLEDGLNWRVVAPFVHDYEWWRTQKPLLADVPLLEGEIETWGATIRIAIRGKNIWVDPGPQAPLPPQMPDVIVITHAHHDHTASLGAWSQAYPSSRIIMTSQTAELLSLQAGFDLDIQNSLRKTIRMDFWNPQKINDIGFRLLPAGHLLGAAMVEMDVDGKKILASGDFSLRDVGGLKGATLPDEKYTLVLVATNASGNSWLPGMDVETSRGYLLSAVNECVNAGKSQILLPLQSLGQAQEAYAALVMAQRAGAFPKHTIYLKDHAAAVSKFYAQILGNEPGPWNKPFGESKAYFPDRSIVIFPDSESEAVKNSAEMDQVLQNQGAVSVNRPLVFTHAGLGEQLAFAMGIHCAQVSIYHGWNATLEDILSSAGRKILTTIPTRL